MLRFSCFVLIVCALLVAGFFVVDQQAVGQDTSKPSTTEEKKEGETKETKESKEGEPVKITIPNYNFASFEGTRAGALNAGLFLCRNQIDAAFAIFQQSSLMNETQMTQLKDKVKVEYTSIITKQYGASQGPEIIEEQRKGEHLYKMVIIDRRQIRPVFWELVYYKTQGQWRLISINYHVQIQRAFD